MWYHFGELKAQQVQQPMWLVARKKGKNTDELAGVMAECNTLNWLSHPNIVQLLSCKFHGSSHFLASSPDSISEGYEEQSMHTRTSMCSWTSLAACRFTSSFRTGALDTFQWEECVSGKRQICCLGFVYSAGRNAI